MTKTTWRLLALWFSAAGALTSLGADIPEQRYTVSILSPKAIAPEERVAQFEVDVVAGAIRSISGLPVGWHIIIDNDASWQTKIKANATVGSAFMSTKDLNGLRVVLGKSEFGDLRFAVSGAVSVTKDTQEERLIRLNMRDFKIGPEH